MLLLFSTTTFAQDDTQPETMYYTVTTMHWNLDYEDWDKETWIAVQKEYMDIPFSNIELDLLKKIKHVFDPKGILNPGKIFI